MASNLIGMASNLVAMAHQEFFGECVVSLFFPLWSVWKQFLFLVLRLINLNKDHAMCHICYSLLT